MGAGAFHVRVRDGIGCRVPAIATRSSNPPKPFLWFVWIWFWCVASSFGSHAFGVCVCAELIGLECVCAVWMTAVHGV